MTKFISEIASSHCGNPKLVEKISSIHCKSQSDFLKFQIFKTINLFPKNNEKFSNFKKLEIKFKQWEKIIKKFQFKTQIILEPFDNESYNFCKKFKKKTYLKVSSSESDNFELIIDAIKNFKKVFINISGLGLNNIKKIINYLPNSILKKKVVFMYGFQSYPTEPKDLRFSLFKFFKKKEFEYGYADHSKFGINNKVLDICSNAKNAFNCDYIEKHVCYSLKNKPNDFITSINIKDINNFIQKIKKRNKISKIKFKKKISVKEKNYFLNFYKFAYLKKNIKKNKTVQMRDLNYLRSTSLKEGITRLKMFGKKIKSTKNLFKGDQLFKSSIIIK